MKIYYRTTIAFLCLLSVIFSCFGVGAAHGDIIIDNGAPETSFTGVWGVSGATGQYGATSLWGRDGNTYTWTFTPPATGTYEVSMWWTVYPSRSTNVPVDIEFSGGTDTRFINQQSGGGKWNVIASYPFVKGIRYDITVTSQAGPTSTSVDAVRFVPIAPVDPDIIIDNGDQATSHTGTWGLSGGLSPYGATSIWNRDGATYTWFFTPPVSGTYAFSMWWTQWPSRSTNVPVHITFSGGSETRFINQQTNGGKWNLIDSFRFNAGTKYAITVTAQPAPTSTCADAVRFTLLDSVPFVNIVSPQNYHLQRSQNLNVTATAAHLASTWAVKFIRDKGTASEKSVIDSDYPYAASFPNTPVGEHTVEAVVVDGAGKPIAGVISGRVSHVGVGGRCIIAVGDSNTTGYGDDDLSDDNSQDGRVTGGGYPPVLNDLLTDEYSSTGTPFLVANEGVPGTTVKNGAASIQSILAKYPDAELCIVQYGVNDAAQKIPSGKGLTPGSPGYAKSYKDYMQQIVTACNNAGVEVAIAKAPIALGLFGKPPYTNPEQGALNILIKEYNEVISELRAIPTNRITLPMPSFYQYFSAIDPSTRLHRYDELYYDNIHPNGQGLKEIARMWFEAIERFGAYIDNVSPNPAVVGSSVGFKGYGYDPDHTIGAYEWRSDIDGILSYAKSFTSTLSAGNHDISLRVQNDVGRWSAPVDLSVTVTGAPSQVIIDNRDAKTSRTGTWPVSGGPDPYGADSLWSRDGTTFNWLFTPARSGQYQVAMWWTQYTSRSSSIPVLVQHRDGQSRRVINQQINGGRWNDLGTYTFVAGTTYKVTITSQPDPASTCADAVRFVLVP